MNKIETKQCQNCKQQFVIEPEDFDFYEKIKVPAPTFCPECRLIRRLSWRNERSLYQRTCNSCSKNIIAMYPPDIPLKVYCRECYWSDSWDAMTYGYDYQWDITFFKQWADLFYCVPKVHLFKIRNNIHCDFINYAADNKNCYLAYSLEGNENIMYSYSVDKNKDCLDCLFLKNSELCYENIDGNNNYHCSYLIRSRDCLDSLFLFDCVNCQNCFLSSNLRNKQYIFENVQYDKDKYFKKVANIDKGSFSALIDFGKKFSNLIRDKSLHRFAHIINSLKSTGDNIENSKNVRHSFQVYNAEEVTYCARVGSGAKDAMDVYGLMRNELNYESFASGFDGYNQLFVFLNDASKDIYYSSHCNSCSNCFGCTGLRNKQYCILNKQYSKQEYEKLVPQIIQHMNDMPYISTPLSSRASGASEGSHHTSRKIIYRYGEFFPPEFSPFAYNETVAQEYFPLTKEQVIEQGYEWKESEKRDYKITMERGNLPDHIKDVSDDILNQVIGCEHRGGCDEKCTTAFKIILDELKFYQKMNLPLPRLCPNCRHYQRLKQSNPLKLWYRKCQCAGKESDNKIYQNTTKHFHNKDHCPHEFETTYAPERKEIIYCKKCYQSEVV